MKSITRSKATASCDGAVMIYREAVKMLEALPKRPVRLIGVGIYNLSGDEGRQLTFDEILEAENAVQERALQDALAGLGTRYHLDFAGNLTKIYRPETLHKTVEYMRRHKP